MDGQLGFPWSGETSKLIQHDQKLFIKPKHEEIPQLTMVSCNIRMKLTLPEWYGWSVGVSMVRWDIKIVSTWSETVFKFKIWETSLTEFRHQMRSGDLLAYLSLNHHSNGTISCPWCYFVQIWSRKPFSQNFNSCVTEQRTDRRTNQRRDWRMDGQTPSYRDARMHLKTAIDQS